MNHIIRIAILLVAPLAAVACTPPAHLATPPGFVSIDDDSYDFRATNADGVVVAVRAMDNDPAGDLAFWSGVIDRQLRESYTATDVIEVEAESGAPGVQIRYETQSGGRLHRYWATIFVTDDRVYLVEAGGDAELFDRHVEAAQNAVLSVELS